MGAVIYGIDAKGNNLYFMGKKPNLGNPIQLTKNPKKAYVFQNSEDEKAIMAFLETYHPSKKWVRELTPLQELSLEYFTQDTCGTDYPMYLCVAIFDKKGKFIKDEGFFLTRTGFEKHMQANGHNYYGCPRLGVRYLTRNPEMVQLITMLYNIFKEIGTNEQINRVNQITHIFR